jgi:hypothetical protein
MAKSEPARSSPSGPAADAPRKPLSPAAQRALEEAAVRRAERDQQATSPKESPQRPGPDPVRYGDWEVKGIASDF